MRPWVWMLHHNIDFATRRIVLITSAISAEIANFGCGSAVPLFYSIENSRQEKEVIESD